MKPVWSKAAIRDLTHAREYIGLENPDAAREIASRIVDASERIIQYPEIGRAGRVIVPGTHYLVVYRKKKNTIHFLRVLHGRQKWPRA